MSAPNNPRYSASVDKPRRGLAVRDIGVQQFREERSFDQELTQEVPRPRRSRMSGRLPFVLVMTAVAAFIIAQVVPAWRASNNRIAAEPAPQMAVTSQTTGVKLATVDPSRSTPASVPKPAEVSTTRLLIPVLRTADEPTRTAIGEAVPLGLNVEGPTDGVVAIIAGLLAGSNLSVGSPVGPTDWQLPARDLARVLVRPPAGFSGAMEVTVDLQGAGDQILDRRWRRLEWKAARPVTAVPADAPAAAVSETNAAAVSAAKPPKSRATTMATNARSTSDSASRSSSSAPPTRGGNYVQVSSQRTELEAHSSFKALQRKFPNVFGSHQATIRRADLGEMGIYYRVMIGPLGIEQATELCSSLRASGGQCLVQQN